MQNKLVTIGAAFTNKLLLASAKSTYTNVFWHSGANWDLAVNAVPVQDFGSLTDNFAVQNKLIRLPKVVRILYNSVGADQQQTKWAATYEAQFASLAATYAPNGIAFTWGRYPPGTNWRWLAEVCPDGLGSMAATDIYVDSVYTFIFRASTIVYREQDYPTAPNGNYVLDYGEFVAKHARHTNFACHMYNSVFGPLTDQDNVLADMFSGSGAFATFGPGLSAFGWTLENRTWDDVDLISESEMASKIDAFFGL